MTKSTDNNTTLYTMDEKEIKTLIDTSLNGHEKAIKFWKGIGITVAGILITAILGAAVKFIRMDTQVSKHNQEIGFIQKEIRVLPAMDTKLELIYADLQILKNK